MTFQPGHNINGNPNGISKAKMHKIVSLAMCVRNEVRTIDVVNWLKEVWLYGREPGTDRTVDMATRMLALNTLLNRGWGAPAQHVIIEGEIRNEVSAAEPVEVPVQLDEIRARRQALRSARLGNQAVALAVASGDDERGNDK